MEQASAAASGKGSLVNGRFEGIVLLPLSSTSLFDPALCFRPVDACFRQRACPQTCTVRRAQFSVSSIVAIAAEGVGILWQTPQHCGKRNRTSPKSQYDGGVYLQQNVLKSRMSSCLNGIR